MKKAKDDNEARQGERQGRVVMIECSIFQTLIGGIVERPHTCWALVVIELEEEESNGMC